MHSQEEPPATWCDSRYYSVLLIKNFKLLNGILYLAVKNNDVITEYLRVFS